jgi:hypothetical protein
VLRWSLQTWVEYSALRFPMAESLTAATGGKFTAAVLDAETFLNETTQPGSMFEPAYSKGGFEFFRYVEDCG